MNNSYDYGRKGEEIAYKFLSSVFNDVIYDPNGKVDFLCKDSINGLTFFIEVKSCLQKIYDHSHTNNSRSGRFALRKDQDLYLKGLENSYYLFIEFENSINTINRLLFIKATDLIIYFNGSNEKSVAFKSIMEVKNG